jgi:chaperonin GroES
MAKKKCTIHPLDDRLVVIRTDAEDQTSGGIFLPEGAKEKPQQGEVIAVGPGRQLESGERAKPDVKVGDVILFGKYAGTEITVDDQEVVILKESDVLAKLS